jgi:hypothetical protein
MTSTARTEVLEPILSGTSAATSEGRTLFSLSRRSKSVLRGTRYRGRADRTQNHSEIKGKVEVHVRTVPLRIRNLFRECGSPQGTGENCGRSLSDDRRMLDDNDSGDKGQTGLAEAGRYLSR